jgi:hypothetical protein
MSRGNYNYEVLEQDDDHTVYLSGKQEIPAEENSAHCIKHLWESLMTGRRQNAGKDIRGLHLKLLGLRKECPKTIHTEEITYFNCC